MFTLGKGKSSVGYALFMLPWSMQQYIYLFFYLADTILAS